MAVGNSAGRRRRPMQPRDDSTMALYEAYLTAILLSGTYGAFNVREDADDGPPRPGYDQREPGDILRLGYRRWLAVRAVPEGLHALDWYADDLLTALQDLRGSGGDLRSSIGLDFAFEAVRRLKRPLLESGLVHSDGRPMCEVHGARRGRFRRSRFPDPSEADYRFHEVGRDPGDASVLRSAAIGTSRRIARFIDAAPEGTFEALERVLDRHGPRPGSSFLDWDQRTLSDVAGAILADATLAEMVGACVPSEDRARGSMEFGKLVGLELFETRLRESARLASGSSDLDEQIAADDLDRLRIFREAIVGGVLPLPEKNPIVLD